MILVTGASGFLGPWVARELSTRGLSHVAWRGARGGPAGTAYPSVNLLDEWATRAAFDQVAPSCVIHCAAEAGLGPCAADPARARALNAEVPERLATLAHARGARFVHVSTDMVFDGEHAPYTERDEARPTTAYGRSKLDGEARVLAAFPGALVVRVPTLYGEGLTERVSFTTATRLALLAGREVRLFDDELRTPLEVREAARRLVSLAGSDLTGVVHAPGPERLSRLDLGRALCREVGANEALLVPVSRLSLPGEPRPRDLSLATVRAAAVGGA